MDTNLCKTLEAIDKARPCFKDSRNNKHKQWRESWVAAAFCKSHAWVNALVCTSVRDEGDDVFVKHENKCYPFQIVEMAPRDPLVAQSLPSSKKHDNGFISCVYGDLAPQITELINILITKKNDKHYANQENMNLLIYLNPPGAIRIDTEIDIDRVALEQNQSSKFKTISVYAAGNVVFIKGDINSLAQV